MKKLIIHIGPPKCGSSSIQRFFSSTKNPCLEKTHFVHLPQDLLRPLEDPEHHQASLRSFSDRLSRHLASSDAVILSHEALFRRQQAVRTLCASFEHEVDQITILGYSRRQSGWLRSAFSQWGLRKKELNDRIDEVLQAHGIDPNYFLSFERNLIAQVFTDFWTADQEGFQPLCDWHDKYSRLSVISPSTKISVRSNTLPKGKPPQYLIEDFCRLADLTLKPLANWSVISNPRRHPTLLEGVNNALSFGLPVPTRLERNNEISNLIEAVNAPLTDGPLQNLQNSLNQYVDSYFLSSNREYCRAFDLDEAYFEPEQQISKEEVVATIREEQNTRRENHVIPLLYRQHLAALTMACLAMNERKPSPAPNRLRRIIKFFKG